MSPGASLLAADEQRAERIRVQGLVQGVGMRPTVWRLARAAQLCGWVRNDGEGVEIRVQGGAEAIAAFVQALREQAPPLARIDRIERQTCALESLPAFQIEHSGSGAVRTAVVADAACCEQCRAEIFDPYARRYRYAFTNCTHCGPRLSIVASIPYDRAGTSMRAFALCQDCRAEYEAPDDRRFHAQPIACHACGPRAQLLRADGAAFSVQALSMLDEVDAACTLLQRGQILAIKGLGGYQLACDAGNAEALAELRRRKRRARKPFALMARDLDVIRQYARLSDTEAALLQSAAAPIVLLDAEGQALPEAVAPGLRSLGFMLPNTPLHHLLLRRMARPIVLTSGNLADEPQCIDDEDARARLSGIADYFLLHNRAIVRRVDDSVARVVDGRVQLLRRARGYAPNPLPLPQGFAEAAPLLALGGELKNSFCLLRRGEAIVSHHMGDLGEARTQADYRRAVGDYLQLFEHQPQAVVIDAHPEYHSSKFGHELAEQRRLPLRRVQHHHAHIAACLADNGVPLNAPPVLGIALDGLGFGDNGEIWGGEFLLADYRSCRRLGSFKPVAMLGGEKAMVEPWRNTYAQLMAELGWPRFAMNYAELDLYRFLEAQPRAVFDAMLGQGLNSPPASSCGRLFDAVAAAMGICRERALYEGQAAIELETLVDQHTLRHEDEQLAYPFAIPRLQNGLPYIEPLAMWQALLGDLVLGTPLPVMAARFHKGLTQVMVRMVEKLCDSEGAAAGLRCVALSGGVFQNRVLLSEMRRRLQAAGYTVLQHRQLPANDGGLSLGQAVIAAAQGLAGIH
ncbi:Hydrogenase maturation protein, carbamoyltransferase HypF [Solimonas aquatica]|uniref:Carbamoyltransferase HypF n=1 Tax=Solimonas aquatica TaxID=489703 RepID=A0A1H9DHY3_9GAMM|nr:carbamoyltransferase HypF [Solimonas aquatica]SEQ13085.1 Hydrogenase maturation protein, carbamoyltransferase HypF [Solimonas aquatica]